MSGCRQNRVKDTCGTRFNAECVFYDRYIPEYSSLLDEECITLAETTEDIYYILDGIKSEIDLTDLGKSCLEYDTEEIGKIKVKEALLTHEQELCEIKETLQTLGEAGCCEDITDWNLDTGCLQDPCEVGFTNLKDVIQAMINKICELETAINT